MLASRITSLLALATSLTTGIAWSDDRESAQQLFREGKALMATGAFAEACPKFAAAATLSATAGVRLNLGDCYDKLGRTASAWTRYTEALSLAEKAGDRAAVELARGRLAALKPRLSYLQVRVASDPSSQGLAIRRDGEALDPSAWGTPVPVDPGAHEVAASAQGRAPWATTVTVTSAGEQTVVVPVLSPVPAEANSDVTPAATPPPEPRAPVLPSEDAEPKPRNGIFSGPGGTQRALAAVGAGLGVAGLAVGSYFGATMLSRKSEYEQHQSPTGRCADLECQTASHDAIAAGNAATIAFVAGGVLLGAGVLLWSTAPRGSTAGAQVAVVPALGPLGANISATGSW
jgi:hypothetical protein